MAPDSKSVIENHSFGYMILIIVIYDLNLYVCVKLIPLCRFTVIRSWFNLFD